MNATTTSDSEMEQMMIFPLRLSSGKSRETAAGNQILQPPKITNSNTRS
jgi:hypothetical protein